MPRSSKITNNKQLCVCVCVCAGGRRRGTWGSGSGGGRPWRHTGRILNTHALSPENCFGFTFSNSWRFISHLLWWRRSETNWPNIQMCLLSFFFLPPLALFNCIMTIMNMSSDRSFNGESCSCKALDNNRCTATTFGFYFSWSLLAFPPAVFHLTTLMKENWFLKLFMFLDVIHQIMKFLKYCNKSSLKSYQYHLWNKASCYKDWPLLTMVNFALEYNAYWFCALEYKPVRFIWKRCSVFHYIYNYFWLNVSSQRWTPITVFDRKHFIWTVQSVFCL